MFAFLISNQPSASERGLIGHVFYPFLSLSFFLSLSLSLSDERSAHGFGPPFIQPLAIKEREREREKALFSCQPLSLVSTTAMYKYTNRNFHASHVISRVKGNEIAYLKVDPLSAP